jgi:hypothetical protein
MNTEWALFPATAGVTRPDCAAGAPYLARFWRDMGGMYQAQRPTGRLKETAFWAPVLYEATTSRAAHDQIVVGFLAPATAEGAKYAATTIEATAHSPQSRRGAPGSPKGVPGSITVGRSPFLISSIVQPVLTHTLKPRPLLQNLASES